MATLIDYQETNSQFKTVVVVGNIGNGKSCLLNALAGDKKAFISKAGTGTQTLGLDCVEFPKLNLRLLDTQGFDCPTYSDEHLYNMLCINLLDPEKNTKI